MKKKYTMPMVIVAVIVVFAVIAGIVYISLKNEEEAYQVELSSKKFIRTFLPPYEGSDDISGKERVDVDGKTMYFKPGRNSIIKAYEVVNEEHIRINGWAIWGLQVYGLRVNAKYKMIVTMAIDQMPEDMDRVLARINTHTLGIEGGHHVCQTPNDNTLEVKATDFDGVEEFKEIAMDFTFKKFGAEDMIHNHEGEQWEEFNGLYIDGALELRVGWAYQRVGIKIKEIRIERVE